ncbi:hypothetical protein CN085_10355 [Sinorhizobium meliloti]|uniref:hypothetical protein n=1 Tax=Rhizobium meliloti TaxID=382 RepID=UPI0002F2B56B|nr:hypothetical protein [Sinorhizobium meliloti]MDE4603972.1 hypothetical protein [Sinorhizobium meliloti]MDE4616959.1 hypothetical protein [Sinorhizobium meliloti]MDX0371264.1 hypothetical protein [Sinorhizobium meliloti]MQU96092.1 hypothetical protein [Sinorhizobium meliloti]RVH10648.1 hypothetical protein CN217_15990 [Sinorhizobium meliloti]
MAGPRRGEEPTPASTFAFLTYKANPVVKPVHPKAMPAIRDVPEEVEPWLPADWQDARTLQRT